MNPETGLTKKEEGDRAGLTLETIPMNATLHFPDDAALRAEARDLAQAAYTATAGLGGLPWDQAASEVRHAWVQGQAILLMEAERPAAFDAALRRLARRLGTVPMDRGLVMSCVEVQRIGEETPQYHWFLSGAYGAWVTLFQASELDNATEVLITSLIVHGETP